MSREKRVVVLDRSKVIAACETASARAYAAEIAKQITDQLGPGSNVMLDRCSVSIADATFDLTCTNINFEWH